MGFTSGSPNSGQLEVGIAIVLQDRFSNQAREASSEIRRLHQDAKNVTNANLGVAQSLTNIGLAAGTAGLYGMGSMVKQGAKFVDTMVFVDAIAEKSGATMAQLQDKAQTLGKQTMFDSQDIASAMQYLAMSGQSTTDIWNNIEASANLAGATLTTLGGKGGAADIMTSIMKQFHIASSEMESAHVADLLTKGTTSAKLELTDLGEAITYAGTTVNNLGGSLEQTIAYMGIMGNAGMRGSMAGVSVANTYRYLAKSIYDTNFKGYRALSNLGLDQKSFMNAKGELIDMGSAMEKIAKAANGKGNVEWFNDLVNVLGVRGERAGSVMAKNFGEYNVLLSKLQNEAGGSAAKIMEMRMNTIAGGIDKMASSWENVVTTYTTQIAPVLTPVFNRISDIFDVLRSIIATPILGNLLVSLVSMGTLFVTIRLALLSFKIFWKLTFNDSTITFNAMAASVRAGWHGMAQSAAECGAIEAAVIAQRKAGLVSNATGMAAATFAGVAHHIIGTPGSWVGGVMAKPDKNGLTRYYKKNGLGATVRTSAAGAATEIGRVTAGKNIGQVLGGAGIAATGLGMNLAKGGLWKGLTTVGGGLLKFLSGPWGFAIMTIASFLPSIISMISGNSDSHQSNTRAIEANTDVARSKAEANNPNKLTEEESRLQMIGAMNALSAALTGKPIANITLNVDGKEAMTKAIEDYVNGSKIEIGAK